MLERLPAPASAPPASESPNVSWREIRRALDALSANDRELLLLVAWDGLSPAQAGSVLGLTPAAARSRLHRARRRLAQRFEIDQSPRRHPSVGNEPEKSPPVRRSGA
ncbi:MAG TPA: sigma factor-like helix-turn-helix DNA-binding protein [Solirubrobacteraceae bacterium]|nr:sigma factor-like helix-turn-helix DNA-binding protein [Solirubrobacteraceae bacterium]